MFTVCPKCTLTLVVTTVDLRAGQGYVRCGRCANVFNALIALREGDPNSPSDTAKQRLAETEPQAPIEPALGSGVAMDPEPEPEPVPESQPEPDEILVSEESLEFDAASTDVSEIFIEPPVDGEGSGNFETVVLAEETPAEIPIELIAEEEPAPEAAAVDEPATDEPAVDEPAIDELAVDEAHIQTHTPGGEWSLDDELPEEPRFDEESASAELPALAEEAHEQKTPAADPAWVQEMFAEAEAEAERQRTGEHAAPFEETPVEEFVDETVEATSDAEPGAADAVDAADAANAADTASPAQPAEAVEPNIEPLLAAPAQPRAPWQYAAGVAVLALVLIGQILHHHRQALVLNPTFGKAVTTVYGWFGVTLIPRWDLTAYTVKQLGAEAEGGEGTRLRVRMSVQNSSERVQPLPLVRLTLKDRYDNPVATRDLEPAEYLPASVAQQRLLEPDQRIDAELHVIDPGRAAIGFEIDACLRAENGAIGCASDARVRPAG